MTLREAARAAWPVLVGLAVMWLLWAGMIAYRARADTGNGWLVAVAEQPTLVLGIVALIVVNWIRGREAKGD